MALAGLMPACGGNEAELQENPPIGVPGVDASIAFEHDGTLTLVPGQTTDIVVIGSPAAPYAVSFILVGEAVDASLAETNVVADNNGVAVASLRAPNKSTNFAVIAKIKDGPSAELPVAVSDQGFGAFDIKPIYPGVRDPREWVASAVSGTTCEQLESTFPNDPAGALKATGEPGEPLTIDVAPVGLNVAIFVRGGHYMWGCADEAALVANGVSEVEVDISDAPIDFSDVTLDVDMEFSPEPVAWDALISAQETQMLDAFFNGTPMTPAQVLLNEMEALSCDPMLFSQNATSYNWTAEVQTHLSMNAVDIASTLSGFAAAGLVAEPPAILGKVTSVDEEPGFATFELISMGSSTPAILGVPSDYQVNIDVDFSDTARIGGTLFWLPSRYIGNAIAQEGLVQYAQYTDFNEVLADVAQCGTLNVTSPVGCDVMSDLCAQAVAVLWEQALDVSAAVYSFGEINFESSGASTFDDWAKLSGFEGEWIGQTIIGPESAVVQGAVSAVGPEQMAR
jgi:hypothetical protein